MSSVGAPAALLELFDKFEQDVPNVIDEVSPDEEWAREVPEAYFASGQWAFRRIKLAMLAAGISTFENIIDLPSGYGRVLRVLKAAFPDAALSACDIHRPAVDFCAQVFGATPVYSTERPEDIPLEEGSFDLLWCGSLLTHVDAPAWDSFLECFESVLRPGGLLVFTACGRFVAEEHLQSSDSPYGIGQEQRDSIIESYRRTGFGYRDYEYSDDLREISLPQHYGIALASPSFVCAQLERRRFDMLTYTAGGWGSRWGGFRPSLATAAQDVIGCIRTAG
jgi:SAM-dependent methyltransferase